jgi:hypothetical protein
MLFECKGLFATTGKRSGGSLQLLNNAFDFIPQLINGERFANYVQSRKHDNPTEQKGCRVLIY